MDREAEIRSLGELNHLIGTKEDAGDKPFFDDLLAPVFALRRASGSHETREIFLAGLTAAAAGSRRSTHITSVTMLGQKRAAVDCLVEQGGKRFENHRVFVRSSPGSAWKLLSWANEPAAEGESGSPSA